MGLRAAMLTRFVAGAEGGDAIEVGSAGGDTSDVGSTGLLEVEGILGKRYGKGSI